MSPAFYIPNHSSTEMRKGDLNELSKLECPHSKFSTKPEFAKWEHDISTDHVFYTMLEPQQPSVRVSRDNPAVRCHGLVADYDGMISDQMHESALLNLPGIPPTWVSRTFSGKARWVWVFEKPVPIFSNEVFAKFIAALAKQLKVGDCLPGLDTPALYSTVSVYELGRDWEQPAGDVKVPLATCYAILHDISKKVEFAGPDIPFEAIESECRRRFGDRIPEPFEPGIRCPRFWDKQADNATGALVHSTGCQAFTGEGRFLEWGDILGHEFVRSFKQSQIGGAIEGIYHDSQTFWVRSPGGHWLSLTSDQTKNHLAVEHGLSRQSNKGAPSAVDSAMNSIVTMKNIAGAFPFLYSPGDVVTARGGLQYLNVSRVEVVQPVKERREWGEGFPWLKGYLEDLFDKEQLRIFLSWIHHFYKSALAGDVRKGQGLFIAGPPGAGKTFLSNVVIGRLMGGTEEVTQFILGETNFNEAHESPVWTVDDAVAASDAKRHDVYSQIVKKVVANFSIPYHPKFKKAVNMPWRGRLIVTLNNDPESIQMLPTIEHSNLDKVIFLLAATTKADFSTGEASVDRELPAFAAFLRDWVIPDDLIGDWRFGVKEYHHPDLLQSAKQSSATAGLVELLDRWRELWFRQSDVDQWQGTATDLLTDMMSTESLGSVVKQTVSSRPAFGRNLHKMINEGHGWIAHRVTNKGTFYTITKEG
jgi:hypothetical protein